jgi:hypothetical protein
MFKEEINMKRSVIFTAAVCCALLLTGFTAAAQETAPLPPPEQGTSAIPAPDVGAPKAPAAARGPGEQAPAQSGRAAQRQAPAAGRAAGSGAQAGSQERAAAQAAAQPAAAQQDAAAASGIPSRGLFWGAMLGGSMYQYSPYNFSLYETYKGKAGFNAGFLVGYDYGLLAVQAEVLFTGDNLKIEWDSGYYTADIHLSGKTIQIPLMLKLDFHLGRIMFQPQWGFYLNMTLGDLESPDNEYGYPMEYKHPLLGMMFGGALGFRIGRGYIFTDARYAFNLGYTEVEGQKTARRSALVMNMGYQYYFKSR